MCRHNLYYQKRKRTFFQKICGFKEVYICTNCGYLLKVR